MYRVFKQEKICVGVSTPVKKFKVDHYYNSMAEETNEANSYLNSKLATV